MSLIIFDVGGVVCTNTAVLPEILDHLKIPQNYFYEVSGEDLYRLQRGEISSEVFWEGFSKRTGIVVNEDLWQIYFRPELNQDTVQIIKKLKEKYRVVAGTNTIECHYNIHKNRLDYKVFDTVYASHLIGFCKPQKEFYEWILKEEKKESKECVFIDDSLKNIAAATQLGIYGVHFTSPDNLLLKLKDLNLI